MAGTTILIFANALFALLVIKFSMILLVKDMRFQPAFATTELGRLLAWSSRVGLAALIVSSFAFFLDVFMIQGYNASLIRECGIGLSLSLIFARMVHKTFMQQHEYANEVFKSVARSTLGITKPKKKFFGYGIGYVLTIVATVAVLSFGPKLEQNFLPVMQDIVYHTVDRTRADQVCWTFEYNKVRDAKPDYIMYLVTSDGKAYDTTLFRNNGGALIPFSMEYRASGQHFKVPVCADIPVEIWSDKNLKMVGEVKYNTGFPWPFHQKVPDLEVPVYHPH